MNEWRQIWKSVILHCSKDRFFPFEWCFTFLSIWNDIVGVRMHLDSEYRFVKDEKFGIFLH